MSLVDRCVIQFVVSFSHIYSLFLGQFRLFILIDSAYIICEATTEKVHLKLGVQGER